MLFLLGLIKPCTQLHPAPSTDTPLHPAPSIFTKFILTSTKLHPPPPSSFQPLQSSLHHPQQYLNQNIARNWAISPNLDPKIKTCPFWLKIGTHCILEVLIANPDLDFWNSDPKIQFWANLGPEIPSSPFCLKIGTHSISRMLIPNPVMNFWNFDSKIQFGVNFDSKIQFWANLGPKIPSSPFCLKIGTHSISKMLISSPVIDFWNYDSKIQVFFRNTDPKIYFWENIRSKNLKFFVLSQSWHTWYLKDADSYFNICFLNFELKIYFW